MVVPDLLHPFFAAIGKAIAAHLRERGYSLVLCSSDEDAVIELQEVESLLARRIDALVLATVQRAKSSRVFGLLQKASVPYVLLDRQIPGLKAPFIGSGDRRIGELATEHLIARGYKRIAHIGLLGPRTGAGRLDGYTATLKQHACTVDPKYVVLVESADDRGEDCGHRAMKKLIGVEPRPDAVFCYNDIIASGAQKALLEAGLKIPEDTALIGVSNLAGLCLWNSFQVPITSVDQNVSRLAALTASAILEMQDRNAPVAPKRVYVPPRIVVRDST